ncbi:MAG: DoxX family membrane protein [Gemmatimonadales bacterium]|nr:DoxX family membrane protein [Gemmatimonadales bacterium]
MRWRTSRGHQAAVSGVRVLLALAFITAGVLHFVKPEPYLAIMPPWLPAHALLVQISGVAELAGGIGLLVERWRRAAGIGLMLLLLAILPANIQMLLNYQARGAPAGEITLLWLRLPLQLVLMAAVWWVAVRSSAAKARPER